jgi:RNA polymerase sigma factor (sigma-70 family)
MAIKGGDGPRKADADDLGALFGEQRDAVYRTIFAYTGGRRSIAEEATAEAFARAIAHEGSIRNPTAWVFRVAFNVANDELRQERRNIVEQDVSFPGPELEGVMEALRRLSPKQRAAVVLRYVLDLETAEVARRMGTAQPTVRVHLHRARTRLRELLGDEEVD